MQQARHFRGFVAQMRREPGAHDIRSALLLNDRFEAHWKEMAALRKHLLEVRAYAVAPTKGKRAAWRREKLAEAKSLLRTAVEEDTKLGHAYNDMVRKDPKLGLLRDIDFSWWDSKLVGIPQPSGPVTAEKKAPSAGTMAKLKKKVASESGGPASGTKEGTTGVEPRMRVKQLGMGVGGE